MITRLIWTTWTSLSAVQERRLNLTTHSLTLVSEGFLKCQPYDPKNPRQKWCISGDHIVNRHNAMEAWDIYRGSKKNNTPILCYEYHNGENQQWRFEYVNVSIWMAWQKIVVTPVLTHRSYCSLVPSHRNHLCKVELQSCAISYPISHCEIWR